VEEQSSSSATERDDDDETEQDDDDEMETRTDDEVLVDSTNAASLDNNGNDTTNKCDLDISKMSHNLNTEEMAKTAASTKKKKHRRTKRKSAASVDPPRVTLRNNPLDIERQNVEGYDTDGSLGPPRGTDAADEALTKEDALPEKSNVVPPTEQEAEPTATPAPIDISEDTFKKLTIPMLKLELTIRKIPLTGLNNKTKLQGKLREALDKRVPVFSKAQLEEERKKNKAQGKKKPDDMSAFAIGAYWRPLKADVEVDEPVNNFPEARAPTVPLKDVEIQARPKYNFSEQFDRPLFTGRIVHTESYAKIDGTTGIKKTESIRSNGRPNPKFLLEHGLTVESSPVEYAEAFLPMYNNKHLDENGNSHLSMQYLARNTNLRAALAFAGEAQHEDWSGDFTVKELRQFLGLYVINGISPSPGLERKFNAADNANYNAYVTHHLGGKNATKRLRQFRAFFSCQDPLKPTPSRTDSPLFKVLSVLKWIRAVGPMSWECGVHLGLDEQTMGFQGHHIDKMRITYKAEGDGFQCDALCDNGFTYSVFFRNEPPPRHYTRAGYSTLHARSLWLFDQLKDKFHRVWVDNLYMSAKFAKAAYNGNNKVLLAGVTRTKDRGLPACIIQEVVDPKDMPTTRGNVKAAVLEGDEQCPQLVAVSTYDTKPVHFISMIAESIKWISKHKKVWNKHEAGLNAIEFLRVNVNDDYNNKMNSVDVADQLRNQYRMDHWLRNKKWWWSVFLWGLGALLTNAYITYRKVQEAAAIPVKDRLTHYDFLHSIASAWIDSNEVDPRSLRRMRNKKGKQDNESTGATPNPAKRSRRHEPTPSPANALVSPATSQHSTWQKAPRVNDNTLHPSKGVLRCRLDHMQVFHCPVFSSSKVPSCALHRWAIGREVGSHGQVRDKIVACSECHVNLFIPCFKHFHTVAELSSLKENVTGNGC